MVVFYQCDEEYELEQLDNDHLYCSQSQWIGERPVCISLDIGEEDDDDEEEDGLEEEEGKVAYCFCYFIDRTILSYGDR